MRMRPIKVVLGFVVLSLLALTVYLVDSIIRCSDDGLSQEKALAIANERLSVKFKGHRFERELKLQKSQHEDDRSWLFYYQVADCSIIISVDKCGVADIGGISKWCSSVQQSKGSESKGSG